MKLQPVSVTSKLLFVAQALFILYASTAYTHLHFFICAWTISSRHRDLVCENISCFLFFPILKCPGEAQATVCSRRKWDCVSLLSQKPPGKLSAAKIEPHRDFSWSSSSSAQVCQHAAHTHAGSGKPTVRKDLAVIQKRWMKECYYNFKTLI